MDGESGVTCIFLLTKQALILFYNDNGAIKKLLWIANGQKGVFLNLFGQLS